MLGTSWLAALTTRLSTKLVLQFLIVLNACLLRTRSMTYPTTVSASLCAYGIALSIQRRFAGTRHMFPVSTQYQSLLFRERLIDVATLLACGRPTHLPAFLSTMKYWSHRQTAIAVPLQTLESFDSAQVDVTVQHFRRPSLCMLRSLQVFINNTPSPLVKEKAQYWDSPEIKRLHGPYALTYLMEVKLQLSTRTSNDRARYAKKNS